MASVYVFHNMVQERGVGTFIGCDMETAAAAILLNLTIALDFVPKSTQRHQPMAP